MASWENHPPSAASGGSGDIKSDGTVPFAANESMGGFKITNLGTPTAGTDAATKSYVDTKIHPLAMWGTTNASSASADRFYGFGGHGVAQSASAGVSLWTAPCAFTITDFLGTVEIVTPNNETIRWLLFINGVATSLDMTLAANTLSQSMTGQSVAVARGDKLSLRSTQSGATALSNQFATVVIAGQV